MVPSVAALAADGRIEHAMFFLDGPDAEQYRRRRNRAVRRHRLSDVLLWPKDTDAVVIDVGDIATFRRTVTASEQAAFANAVRDHDGTPDSVTPADIRHGNWTIVADSVVGGFAVEVHEEDEIHQIRVDQSSQTVTVEAAPIERLPSGHPVTAQSDMCDARQVFAYSCIKNVVMPNVCRYCSLTCALRMKRFDCYSAADCLYEMGYDRIEAILD